jgi:FkbM family methyltransferase
LRPAIDRASVYALLLRRIATGSRGKARLGRLLLRSLKERAVTSVDSDGNTMWLPNLKEPVAFYLWMDGVYEPNVKRFLLDSCASGDTFIDVGANIGVFTVPLAKHVGPGGRVLAVEASPSVADALRRNVKQNELENVIIEECAAADIDGARVEFYDAPPEKFGMGSRAPQFSSKPRIVDTRTVDEMVRRLRLGRVAAMKVDVEGFEATVFLGAGDLLRTEKPRVVFEFSDWAEERAFPGRRGWAQEILLDYGYRLYRLDQWPSRKQLREPLRHGGHELVAIHDNQEPNRTLTTGLPTG